MYSPWYTFKVHFKPYNFILINPKTTIRLSRHMGDSQLSAMLSTLKISQPDAKEIVGIAKTSQYQLACQKHFEITHPGHQNMPNLKNVSAFTVHVHLP